MADITFKGLTGVYGTVTIADPTTATIDDLITAIAAEEGLDTNYYQISKIGNPSANSLAYGDSSTTLDDASVDIGDGDTVLCTTNQAGTKQERQLQKLEIAQLKRQGTFRDTGTYANPSDAPYYRPLNTYDINLLPNPYNGNSADPDDGDAGPLDDGRPWT